MRLLLRSAQVGETVLRPVDHLCWAEAATSAPWAVRLAPQFAPLQHQMCNDRGLGRIHQLASSLHRQYTTPIQVVVTAGGQTPYGVLHRHLHRMRR